MTVEFEIRTTIAAPPATAFDLSLDIDAHMASMADSHERAIAGVTSRYFPTSRDTHPEPMMLTNG